MAFKDHFSGHANLYAGARPGYPDDLFRFLTRQCVHQRLAWDCATGNGQAARGLAGLFHRVLASDASHAQLRQAGSGPGIHYVVAGAEQAPLAPGSVDLLTVAQAFHWFDIPRFHAEARRVLAPAGVIAIWAYGIHSICQQVDAVVAELYDSIIGSYWPPERRHVESGYAGLPFPYRRLAAPAFSMTCQWSLSQLTGYLYSWSAVQRYQSQRGQDPVALVAERLHSAWGDAPVREVRWPLTLLLGRND